MSFSFERKCVKTRAKNTHSYELLLNNPPPSHSQNYNFHQKSTDPIHFYSFSFQTVNKWTFTIPIFPFALVCFKLYSQFRSYESHLIWFIEQKDYKSYSRVTERSENFRSHIALISYEMWMKLMRITGLFRGFVLLQRREQIQYWCVQWGNFSFSSAQFSKYIFQLKLAKFVQSERTK